MLLKTMVPFILMVTHTSLASDLSDIENFRQYSDSLSSSGQPSAEQLALAANEGYERVIYLAFNDNETAIAFEDTIVKKLSMEYVHLPIDFQHPTIRDFKSFMGVMQQGDNVKTLVHCQVNFRASTFSFLYRVIAEEVAILDAKNNLDSVWSPNEVWFLFIRSVLESYGLTEKCDGCDWGEHEFIDGPGS